MPTIPGPDRSFLSACALSLCAAAAGCGDHAATEARQAPLLDTGAPYSAPSSVPDLVPLPVSGDFPLVTRAGLWSPLHGQYSDGRDLGGAPAASADDWITRVQGSGTVAPASLRSYLRQAADAGQADLSGLDPGAASAFAELVGFLGGGTTTPAGPYQTFAGYQPLRGRWQDYNIGADGNRTELRDPPELSDLRERGARLYCAARQVQARASKSSLGEQAAFSTRILGTDVRFMVVEPTVALGGLKAFTDPGGRFATRDGGQAFEVPMLFGTKITPIAGLLPGLREIRYPAVLLSGDGEVRQAAARRLVPVGSGFAQRYTKEYMTISHGDAALGAWQTITTRFPSFVLFTAGAVTVTLQIHVDFDIGRPTGAAGRVLNPRYLAAGFPGDVRDGWPSLPFFGLRFHDGAWGHRPDCREIDCPRWDFAVLPEGDSDPAWQTTIGPLGPMYTRLLQDDDHSLGTRTAMTLGGDIRGSVGVPRVGPFQISLDVDGGLSGTVGQTHLLRDGLLAARADGPGGGGAMHGITALSVRPRTDASADLLPTTATLHLLIDLGFFGTLSWDPTLFTIPSANLASYDSDSGRASSPWGEASTLRIGTGSAAGDPMKQPAVPAHLPGAGPASAPYASFPIDVDRCLADPTPSPPPPPPCMGKPATSGPPRGNVCAYSLGQFPTGVCGDVAGFVARTGAAGDQAACLVRYYGFLCRPVSYQGGPFLSHILDLSSQAVMSELGDIQLQCATAFVPRTGDAAADKAAAKAYLDRTFKLAVCDDSARPLSGGEILGAAGDPTVPPPVSFPPDACR